MQVPSCWGVQGIPLTDGNSSIPPPTVAPVPGATGGAAESPPVPPLTQTPSKSLGTVP